MRSKGSARWQAMSHDNEPLRREVVRAHSTDHTGPVPEFVAKKRAEQRLKTYLWYEEALTGFLAFLEERGLGKVGDVTREVGQA